MNDDDVPEVDDEGQDDGEPGVLRFPNELARRVARAVGSATHRPRRGGPSPS